MEESDEYEVSNHKDQGTDRGTNGEETDETDDSKISTSRGLLQRSWVDESFGVNVRIKDEEQVVPVGQVDKIKSNRGKA